MSRDLDAPSATPPARELTVDARVAAPRDVVWADVTEPEPLASWFWPSRLEAVATIDLDGAWEVRSEPADMAVLASVREAHEPHRLRLAWRWDGETDTTDVDIALEAVTETETRVVVHHGGFATDEERDAHVEGWTHCLGRLVTRHAESAGGG